MFKTLGGKELYRIGDCIISVNAENPSKNFGGTWQLLCPGRTLVCVDTSQSEFNTLKKTGGSKTHILTTAQMPSHTHTQNAHSHGASSGSGGSHTHVFRVRHFVKNGTGGTVSTMGFASDNNDTSATSVLSAGAHTHSITVNKVTASNQNTGGGQAHNNLQPFMAVYIWVRIA